VSARDRAIRDLVDALSRLVRADVEELLAARDVLSGIVFSGDSLPPRTSRRQFFAACRARKVAGATRDGRGWKCTASAWAEYRTRAPEHHVRGAAAHAAAPERAANDDGADLDGMLENAGLRQTRGRSTR